MKYPRMTKQQKITTGACKLTDSDILTIRNLYKQGQTAQKIATQFGVSDTAVYYWVNLNYRLKVLERSRRVSRKIWKSGENARKEVRRRTQRIWMRRKTKESLFKQYLKEKWAKRGKEMKKVYQLYKSGKLVNVSPQEKELEDIL